MGDGADEAFDTILNIMEQDGDFGGFGPAKLSTCRYCGLKGLHWEQINNKWRLHTSDGNVHSCKGKEAPAPKPVAKEPSKKAPSAKLDSSRRAIFNLKNLVITATDRDLAQRVFTDDVVIKRILIDGKEVPLGTKITVTYDYPAGEWEDLPF